MMHSNWYANLCAGYPGVEYPAFDWQQARRQVLETAARRVAPQMPIGMESEIVKPGKRVRIKRSAHCAMILTSIVCAANRARKCRRSQPTLEARVTKGGTYAVDFPEDKLPSEEAILIGEQLDVAFLIEDVTIGNRSLYGGTRYLADSFYPNCDSPSLKAGNFLPGEELVIHCKNIGRAQAVLRATLWYIDGSGGVL